MPSPSWSPIEFPPGVIKNKSAQAGSGYVVDTIGYRFVGGYPETQGGWEALNTTLIEGRARGALFWNTLKGSPRYAIGTHLKLYGSLDGEDVTDITPVRVSDYLTDAFKAVDGSDTVVVTHTAHGRSNGDTVRYYGNADIGGTYVGDRIIDGEYTIANKTTDTFEITQASVVSTAALSSPFATTNTDETVVVTDAAHAKVTGQKVNFSGASAVGGITPDGEYEITRLSADTYSIEHGSAATSDASGGGTVTRAWVYDRIGSTPSDSGRVYYTFNLTNPFTTTAGSKNVSVAHTAHGATVGDEVRVYNATAVGGITLSGAYKIKTSTDADNFIVEHSTEASSSATAGGPVHLEYDLGVGPADTILENRGYGQGSYGFGAYGSTNLTLDPLYYEPRIWGLSKVLEDIVAVPIGGQIHYWDVSAGGRATAIWQGPETCRFAYWSKSKFLTALGIDGDPLAFGWASIGTVNEWESTSTNTAKQNRRVEDGSALIAGISLSKAVDIIWTDTAAYSHQYIGGQFIFKTTVIGSECGLVGPQAMRVVGGVAYWLSSSGFKMSSGLSVEAMPNSQDIEAWVLDQIDDNQIVKTFAAYIPKYDEIRFHFVPEQSGEPSKSVTFMRKLGRWYPDEQRRTTGGHFNTRDSKPYLADIDGYVYKHETGTTANGSDFTKTLTFGPISPGKGSGQMEFLGFDPDFEYQTGTVSASITTWDHLKSDPLETDLQSMTETDDVADFRASGRWAQLSLSTTGANRLGVPSIETNYQGRNSR